MSINFSYTSTRSSLKLLRMVYKMHLLLYQIWYFVALTKDSSYFIPIHEIIESVPCRFRSYTVCQYLERLKIKAILKRFPQWVYPWPKKAECDLSQKNLELRTIFFFLTELLLLIKFYYWWSIKRGCSRTYRPLL